jgi:hypothetical protein
VVAQDLSNYWFPKLYFQDPKTKLFEQVSSLTLTVADMLFSSAVAL